MKEIKKEVHEYILFWIVIFILLMEFISFVLNSQNYQFLNWVKYTSMLISFAGILLGTIQLLKRKKVLCVTVCILEVLAIGMFNLCLLISYNSEKIVLKDNKRMVQETHSFLFSNWIKYYDYKNIFVRSKQERIFEAHDDSIGEYLYTIYYDENGDFIKKEE